MSTLNCLDILLKKKSFSNAEERKNFLLSLKSELFQLISIDIFNKFPEECLDVLRHYFNFYAESDHIEGLKFFSQFPSIIKVQKFNPLKAFLFYFAYQTKRFNYPMVKVLLGQELINVNIIEPRSYTEFCMFCFYKGLYYIEKKDFFMASYLYSISTAMGFRDNYEGEIFLNQFSIQMLRSLCFLKYLTDLDIRSILFTNRHFFSSERDVIQYETVEETLNFLKSEKNDLQSLQNFLKSNKDFDKTFKLVGLKREVLDFLNFKKIKEILGIYKTINLTKLVQLSQIEFNDVKKVIKKKVMEGKLNIKYDEVNDMITIFDVDPGLKERVQRTKDLYSKIIDANKNLFINLKDKKLNQLNTENYTDAEKEFLKMKHQGDYEIEIPNENDMDLDTD